MSSLVLGPEFSIDDKVAGVKGERGSSSGGDLDSLEKKKNAARLKPAAPQTATSFNRGWLYTRSGFGEVVERYRTEDAR